MSGIEVAGIVLGIVQLYPLGEKLCKRVVKHFKNRDSRKNNNNGGESKALEASLRHGGRSIRETYDRVFRRLGPKFARGDVIAQNRLLRERIRLDDLLISLLLDHLNGNKTLPPNYRTLHDLSRSVRRSTISALTDLYQRQSQAAAPWRMTAPPAPPPSSSPSPSESDSESSGSNLSDSNSSDSDSESSESESEESSSRRNCRRCPGLKKSKNKRKCCGCGWSCKMCESAEFKSYLRAAHGHSTRDKQKMRWRDFARIFHRCQGFSIKWGGDTFGGSITWQR